MATPVTLVPNGTPVTPTNTGAPVTLVGGTTTGVVSDGDDVMVNNSAGSESAPGTLDVSDGNVTGVDLGPTVAIVGDGTALVIPVTGTYVDTATFTVANGVVTGIVLS